MRVAVVGGGISGIAAAHHLQGHCDVTVFEAAARLGGHTDTHELDVDGTRCAVDSGFIVFNARNYPHFTAWLDELGVASQPTDMSFGVHNLDSGLEYGTVGLAGLFARRRNAVSPAFWRMLGDVRRFYGEARQTTAAQREATLGHYLATGGYSDAFVEDHLGPMCAALWSQPLDAALEIPLGHVIAFMAHHRMLDLGGRPQWRVVSGGSSTYLRAFEARFRGTVRTREPVRRIRRRPGHALVETYAGAATFDAVFIACHSDQALRLLADPTPAECEVLGAIRYQHNHVVVHSDPSVMPSRRAAWASWNVQTGDGAARISYWMNRLQSLSSPTEVFVTLNPTRPLTGVWAERDYYHPVFDARARRAQRRKAEISGVGRTFYCGAYWGWGFHEDGFASALGAVHGFLTGERELSSAA